MELFRALAVFAEPPRAVTVRVAEALGLGGLPTPDEYTETFVFQLYPYASVYLGAEGMLGGEARDRVAGFWRALGLSPPAEADHLSTLLGMYAGLCEAEGGAEDERSRGGWRRARSAFLWEHLLSWAPVYLEKLAGAAPPFYRAWAGLLADALAGEARALGEQESLPLHLREAPTLVDPREGEAGEFLRSLLAPVRCGMILTRADLARAARSLALTLRPSERRFMLENLLAQDARGALSWLAGEARAWAGRHGARRETYGEVAGAWESKAAGAARLLGELTP